MHHASIIDTLLEYIDRQTTIQYNSKVNFLIQILCNELLRSGEAEREFPHNHYRTLLLIDGIVNLIKKCTIELQSKVVFCLCGFGRSVQCRLCLYCQRGINKNLCLRCAGADPENNYQIPTQPPICITNAVTLLTRIGFFQWWTNNKNESFGSHTVVFEEYYKDAVIDDPEYLRICKAVCAHDGDQTALRVCFGYLYSKTQLDSPGSWQPMNKCLRRWKLNRTVVEVVCSFLIPSNCFQDMIDRVM